MKGSNDSFCILSIWCICGWVEGICSWCSWEQHQLWKTLRFLNNSRLMQHFNKLSGAKYHKPVLHEWLRAELMIIGLSLKFSHEVKTGITFFLNPQSHILKGRPVPSCGRNISSRYIPRMSFCNNNYLLFYSEVNIRINLLRILWTFLPLSLVLMLEMVFWETSWPIWWNLYCNY